MGRRGPLPIKQLEDVQRLKSLKAPSWLSPAAQEFWCAHASWLDRNQLLHAQTADSFALLADLWQRLADLRGQPTSRMYLDTSKAFTALAKQFRLSPTEKAGTPPDRHHDKGAFEWEEER